MDCAWKRTQFTLFSMQLTYNDVLTLMLILATGLLIIVLYNLIFVSVYVRKLTERMDYLSKEVETIILKPLGMIDYGVEWLSGFVDGMKEGEKLKKQKKHGQKKDVVEAK